MAAAFVDVADEREDVPQPTRARPVSSPTITRAASHDVIVLLRDFSGSYALPFYCCIGIELTAAVLIMIRGRHAQPPS